MMHKNKNYKETFDKIDIIINKIGCCDGHELQEDRDSLITLYNFIANEEAEAEYQVLKMEEIAKHKFSKGVISRIATMSATKAEHEIRAGDNYLKHKMDMLFDNLNFKILQNKRKTIEKKLDSLASAIRRAAKEQAITN